MTQHPIRRQRAAGTYLLAALVFSAGGGRADSAEPVSAGALVEASGIRGGLVVVIGLDFPALLSDLRAAGPYLVHGLDADPGKVDAARRQLRRQSIYGPVTVSRLRGAELPYVDSLVNMIVVTGRSRIPADEMIRALSPGGVIADVRGAKVEITRKERPVELDEWTHYLYDASNNAVSKDTVVDPPQGLRWT
ncbi:MAG: class I SAM-dependent methyltransferase, partial [Planctomycetota bacterium]